MNTQKAIDYLNRNPNTPFCLVIALSFPHPPYTVEEPFFSMYDREKVPSPNAAFVNSAMSHARDFDDTIMQASLHPSAVVVPSAFAISESVKGINGKKFIASICVAIELGCRIGSASRYRRLNIPGGGGMGGWDNTPIIGFFEAASLGKLIDLDREGIHNALGIAYMQAAGNTQCLRDGTLTKRMGPG